MKRPNYWPIIIAWGVCALIQSILAIPGGWWHLGLLAIIIVVGIFIKLRTKHKN
jgi:hypothetical protein